MGPGDGQVNTYGPVVWAMGQVAMPDEVDLVLELLGATAVKQHKRQLMNQERLMVARAVKSSRKVHRYCTDVLPTWRKRIF